MDINLTWYNDSGIYEAKQKLHTIQTLAEPWLLLNEIVTAYPELEDYSGYLLVSESETSRLFTRQMILDRYKIQAFRERALL